MSTSDPPPGEPGPNPGGPLPGPAATPGPSYGAPQNQMPPPLAGTAVPGPTGAPGGQAGAPFGRDPLTGEPYSDKSKMTAGLLELFLGGFGVGRFYLGYTNLGVIQLVTCGGCGVWAIIDAIQILTGKVKDAQGRPLRP